MYPFGAWFLIIKNCHVLAQTGVDRHGPRPLLSDCHLAEHPPFSLYTTFNDLFYLFKESKEGKLTGHQVQVHQPYKKQYSDILVPTFTIQNVQIRLWRRRKSGRLGRRWRNDKETLLNRTLSRDKYFLRVF
jgi:hypothetical protein